MDSISFRPNTSDAQAIEAIRQWLDLAGAEGPRPLPPATISDVLRFALTRCEVELRA